MIIKQVKKIIPILLIILLCMIFPLNTYRVMAAPDEEDSDETLDTESGGSSGDIEVTLENAREQIASYAERLAGDPSFQSRCIYNENKRAKTYMGELPSSSDPFYYFDCVGWVNFVIHKSIEIDFGECHKEFNENGGGFVTPGSERRRETIHDTSHFVRVDLSQAQRGDILIAEGQHVAIFLGDGKVADMWVDRSGGLQIRGLSGFTMTSWGDCTFDYAASLISLDGVNFGELPGGIDIDNIPAGTLTAPKVDLDDIIQRMEFDGMPPDVSYNGGHSLMYYIDKVSEAFNYLVGIMFNGIKVTVVTAIDGVQSLITNAMDFLSGTNTT